MSDRKTIKTNPRKVIELDVGDTVERLAFLHLSNKDIALICNCSVDTLTRRWKDRLDYGKVQGKRAVRHSIFKSATKFNNIKAQIYLDAKINGDPIENAEDLTNKLQELGKELYKIAGRKDVVSSEDDEVLDVG